MQELVTYSIPNSSKTIIVDDYTKFGFIANGKEYIDCVSNKWEYSLGFQRHDIIDYVSENMKQFPACKFNYTNKHVLHLNDLLKQITNFSGINYAVSGSDAVETAIRYSRIYNKRKYIISYEGSYHGSTELCASLSGCKFFNKNVPKNEHIIIIPQPEDNDIQPLLDAIDSVGAENISCILKEPFSIQTSSVICSPEYYQKVRDLCDEHDILFIVDEVATGFGRTGEWFGYQRLKMQPDMIVVGKALTSGYFPLSATIVNEKVRKRIANSFLNVGFTQSPAMSGVFSAIKSIEIIDEENLLSNAYKIESLTKQNNSISIGCYFSYEVQSNKYSGIISKRLKNKGVICSRSSFGDPAVRFLFQNNCDEKTVKKVMDAFYESIDDATFESL